MQHPLERVVRLGAHAQRLAERGRADGREHELLEVDVRVGVRAAVEHVHARQRQRVRVRAADVAVEREVALVGAGLRHRERDAEQRVGAEAGLVVGAVELDQRLVEQPLVEPLEPDDRLADLAVDVRDRLLRRPCRRSGRRRRAARPPRGRRCSRRSGPPPGPRAPERSSTSTSTVGLPRESRISRAMTSTMMLTGPRAWCCCGRSVECSRLHPHDPGNRADSAAAGSDRLGGGELHSDIVERTAHQRAPREAEAAQLLRDRVVAELDPGAARAACASPAPCRLQRVRRSTPSRYENASSAVPRDGTGSPAPMRERQHPLAVVRRACTLAAPRAPARMSMSAMNFGKPHIVAPGLAREALVDRQLVDERAGGLAARARPVRARGSRPRPRGTDRGRRRRSRRTRGCRARGPGSGDAGTRPEYVDERCARRRTGPRTSRTTTGPSRTSTGIETVRPWISYSVTAHGPASIQSAATRSVGAAARSTPCAGGELLHAHEAVAEPGRPAAQRRLGVDAARPGEHDRGREQVAERGLGRRRRRRRAARRARARPGRAPRRRCRARARSTRPCGRACARRAATRARG